jgi:hypothetical protein
MGLFTMKAPRRGSEFPMSAALVHVVGVVLSAIAGQQAAFEVAEREAERLARLTPFALPEGMTLPPALSEAFAAFVEADMFAHAAGLCLRFSFSRAGVEPDGALEHVRAWWGSQTPDARKRVEEMALVEAVHLEGDADAFEGATLDAGVAEGLAIKWDSFFCATTTLWQMSAGHAARRAEADLRTRLGAILAAQPPGEPWASPLLDAWARRGGGWWTVAPGAEAPPLDADAFDLNDDEEERLLEDVLALADEEADM